MLIQCWTERRRMSHCSAATLCVLMMSMVDIGHHRKVAQYINLYNGIKPHVNTYKFIHCYKDLQGVNLYGVKLYTVYMATPYKTHVKPHVFYTI